MPGWGLHGGSKNPYCAALQHRDARLFTSAHDARGWVEQEAAALGGVPIAWVNQPRHAGRGEGLGVEVFNAA
jgi:hypothetical protein